MGNVMDMDVRNHVVCGVRADTWKQICCVRHEFSISSPSCGNRNVYRDVEPVLHLFFPSLWTSLNPFTSNDVPHSVGF